MPLVLSGTNGVLDNSGAFIQGTSVASTSGTSIDFTSIPSWVKRVTVMFSDVSTNGTSNLLVQIGAGSITSSGYTGSVSEASSTNFYSTGFQLRVAQAAAISYSGSLVLATIGSNVWIASGTLGNSVTYATALFGGAVGLSGVLDRVRITTINGTDTFDSGTINILYE